MVPVFYAWAIGFCKKYSVPIQYLNNDSVSLSENVSNRFTLAAGVIVMFIVNLCQPSE